MAPLLHLNIYSIGMKHLQAGRSIPRRTITYYLVGDDAANKSYFFHSLGVTEEENSQEVNVYVQPIDHNLAIELYDFPNDKTLRPALELYLHILEPPTLILYFLSIDARGKDIAEWVRRLYESHPHTRLLFVSDVNTYSEREKLLNRVGKEFELNVVEHVCFVNL